MLGCEIADPDSVEEGGQIRGMELLPVRTVLQKEKHRCQTDGTLDAVDVLHNPARLQYIR